MAVLYLEIARACIIVNNAYIELKKNLYIWGAVMNQDKSVLVVDYKERIIWFDGEITTKTAEKFSKILKKLDKIKVAPIAFYIRGPGGDPWSTFSMLNDIVHCESPVVCIAHGHVASGCFTLTQAGKQRAALTGTKFIFHSAVGVSYNQKFSVEWTQLELGEWLKRLELIDAIQLSWFLLKGRPAKLMYDFLKKDKVIGVSKAKKLNLIDFCYDKKDFIKDRNKIKKISRSKI